MNEKSHKKISKKKQLLSALLILALVITGIFAFLTAQDSKTNKFTVGRVEIELWEDFDANNDNAVESYGHEDNEVSFVANATVPNLEVLKQPYIKNTGTVDAYVYMVVGIPKAEQQFLRHETAEMTQDEIDALNLDADGWAEDPQELFDMLNSSNKSMKDIGTSIKDGAKWLPISSTKIDTLNASSDDMHYYLYAYADESNNLFKLEPNATTAKLFEKIKVNNYSMAKIFEEASAGEDANEYGFKLDENGSVIPKELGIKIYSYAIQTKNALKETSQTKVISSTSCSQTENGTNIAASAMATTSGNTYNVDAPLDKYLYITTGNDAPTDVLGTWYKVVSRSTDDADISVEEYSVNNNRVAVLTNSYNYTFSQYFLNSLGESFNYFVAPDDWFTGTVTKTSSSTFNTDIPVGKYIYLTTDVYDYPDEYAGEYWFKMTTTDTTASNFIEMYYGEDDGTLTFVQAFTYAEGAGYIDSGYEYYFIPEENWDNPTYSITTIYNGDEGFQINEVDSGYSTNAASIVQPTTQNENYSIYSHPSDDVMKIVAVYNSCDITLKWNGKEDSVQHFDKGIYFVKQDNLYSEYAMKTSYSILEYGTESVVPADSTWDQYFSINN